MAPLEPTSAPVTISRRSEEHTSELQSRLHLVCRLLLAKKEKPPALEGAPRKPARTRLPGSLGAGAASGARPLARRRAVWVSVSTWPASLVFVISTPPPTASPFPPPGATRVI